MNSLSKTRLAIALSCAIITLIIYLPSLQNEFVSWDDKAYVYENTFIRSLDAKLLTTAFLDYPVSYWHPLTWISHALDYSLWGLNPMGHHLTNIILHAINTLIVVFLVLRLLAALKEAAAPPLFMNDRAAIIAAAATGLLFGLHPLHVESVAWVSERKDLLCALFFLSSMMMYIGYADRVRRQEDQTKKWFSPFINKRYLMTLGFFILALLSKPMAVSLPFVLLILDWYPLKRIHSFRRLAPLLIEKLPFIVLSLFTAMLTVHAQKAVGSMDITEATSLATRFLVAAKALIAYLGMVAWPLNLVPLYPYPREVSVFSFQYLMPVVLAVLITIFCLAHAKKQHAWLALWCYYVVTLIPVLGILQVGGQAMADRYMYLPSLAPFLLAGVGAAWISIKINSLQRGRQLARVSGAGAAILLVVCLSWLTVKQIGVWKNSIVLWSYVIEKEPGGVPSAYYDRGVAFHQMGRIDKALEDFEQAIALDPFYFEAYTNRGMVYGELGLLDNAIESFNASIAINPNIFQTYVNRGLTQAMAGRYDNALRDFDTAIELNQDFALSYFNRGKIYASLGRKELALADYAKACGLGYPGGCAELR